MKIISLLSVIALVSADLYMQFPPGGNDRHVRDGNARDNANNNRLFDSQNNNNAGYNLPAEALEGYVSKYQVGSKLRVEWTAQHGCGKEGPNHCQIIMQYMCSDGTSPEYSWRPDLNNQQTVLIRDGLAPLDDNGDETPINVASQTDLQYGMHEDYWYFNKCNVRMRNMGLFLADRVSPNNDDVNGNTARFTRQNNNGQQNGFECPEERDYYPYWHPSPWKDVVVFTSQHDEIHPGAGINFCDWYKAESQNVKNKGECVNVNDADTQPSAMNNKADCEENSEYRWQEVGAWGIPAPECLPAIHERTNHHGNAVGSLEMAHYDWTIPDEAGKTCVIRLRYNMSSDDFPPWTTDSRGNGYPSPVLNDDPYVSVGWDHEMRLAIDTDQFARTFEDRTHTFKIIPAAAETAGHTIWNVGVRGRRGYYNERYPGAPYDFVPNDLELDAGDFVHFQWVGTSTNGDDDDDNDGRNHGEGTRDYERHNIVQIKDIQDNFPLDSNDSTTPRMFNAAQAHKFAYIDQPLANCLTLDQLLEKHSVPDYPLLGGEITNEYIALEQDQQNCAKLNAAPRGYFDGGNVQFNQAGVYNYMSTRENNFGVRTLKGTVRVN